MLANVRCGGRRLALDPGGVVRRRKPCEAVESGSDVAELRVGWPAVELVPGGVGESSADGQRAVLEFVRDPGAIFFLQAKLGLDNRDFVRSGSAADYFGVVSERG